MLVYSMSLAGRCVSSYSIVKQPRGEVRRAKEGRSLFAYFGPGGALIPLSSPPSKIEGDGAPQGAWPGLRQTGPGARDSRASPDRRALGVKRHAPRLAARQRGILAFVPLTVVGPGRGVGPGRAGRVPPGDEVASSIARRCRSRSPPSRRLRKAPLVEWIGMAET